MANNNKIDALKTLQGVISRLEKNSFANKGWMVALLTAMITVSYSQPLLRSWLSAVLYTVLVFLFWLCDAYYQGLANHFRSVMNNQAMKLSDESYSYLTMLGNIKGICVCKQIKAAFQHFFDASVFPFYLVVWVSLMFFTFGSPISNDSNPKTLSSVDSVYVDKKVEELKLYMSDSIARKIDVSLKRTSELGIFLHDSLYVKKKVTIRKQTAPCVKYVKLNTCNDTIVSKSEIMTSHP